MNTPAHPAAAFGKDLQRRENRRQSPSVNDPFQLTAIAGRNRHQQRIGAPDGQDHRVTDQVDQAAQKLGRLNSLRRALLQQPQNSAGLMPGQRLEHLEQALVGGSAQQRVDNLDRQLGAARRQQPVKQRLGVPQ